MLRHLAAHTLCPCPSDPFRCIPPSFPPTSQAQSRKFRSDCWAALSRAPPSPGTGAAAAAWALPPWVGALTPGQPAGMGIPPELRPTFRVDPWVMGG